MATKLRKTPEERIAYILRLLKGEAAPALAEEADITVDTLTRWKTAFVQGGQSALREAASPKPLPTAAADDGLPGLYPSFMEELRPALEPTYSFAGELGRGKNGVTCKLCNRFTGSFYCLKTVNLARGRRPDIEAAREKLSKEVQILAPLRHRCLPCIYERDLEGTLPYYVATFHPGQTFNAFREGQKQLSPGESTFVILSLIDALRTIHGKGRTHCDLHEDNVMISDRVFADGILIIDFGSGHRQSESSPQTPDGGFPQFKRTPALSGHHRTRDRASGQADFEASDYRALGDLLSGMAECFFGDAPHDQPMSAEFGWIFVTCWGLVGSGRAGRGDRVSALSGMSRAADDVVMLEPERGCSAPWRVI